MSEPKPMPTYWSLAEEVTHLHGRLDQLEAENAKLREERNHWHVEQVHAYGNWEDAHKRATELEAENAKLRELVSGYADSFERSAAMNNGNGPYYSGEDWLSLANDMRFDLAEACGELGIEVDG